MSSNSDIQWTGSTWNPIAGCTPVSPGCLNCYAAKMSHRLESMGQEKYRGLTVLHNGRRTFNGKINFDDDSLTIPLRRKKPETYFVNSMSDLFHDEVPVEFIARVFAVMGLASWHTFQVLTKRPERMARLLTDEAFQNEIADVQGDFSDFADDAAQRFGLVNVHERLKSDWRAQDHETLPLHNVWLGTSVENQKCADERIPHLLRCPAAVRFLSMEPLLEAVDLLRVDAAGFGGHAGHKIDCIRKGYWSDGPLGFVNHSDMHDTFGALHWVIIGGESGSRARPFDVAWAMWIIGQCRDAGVACFVKQLGAKPFDSSRSDLYFDGKLRHRNVPDDGKRAAYARTVLGSEVVVHSMKLNDSHGGDMAEWPEDLRVREFPKVNEVSHV